MERPGPKVVIVGAGMAGLTAALRLAERGFQVTVLEKSDVAGGNLGGTRRGDVNYEVYPHMFGAWYNNFWALMQDAGVSREKSFEALPICGFLERGDFPHYRPLVDNGSWRTAIRNLYSGIMSPANMFLGAYAILDLLTQDFENSGIMGEQTLNGFVVTRPYATPQVAAYFDRLDDNIWSVDSFQSSAYAFQRFAHFQFREPSPQCWVVRDNSCDDIVAPLCAVLAKRWGVAFRFGVSVNGVSVEGRRARRLSLVDKATGKAETMEVENLMLAVSPTALAHIVMTPAHEHEAHPAHDAPIVRSLPQLANVRRLASLPLPVLYVTFNRQLAGIPDYYVALVDSRYSLTFVKVRHLSERFGTTVLALAASDFDALPVDLEQAGGNAEAARAATPQAQRLRHEAAMLMLREFARYVPAKVGAHWGDAASDIDWARTYLETNLDQKLFLNEPGSRLACPEAHYPMQVENLFFAGDACRNPITTATVESAVYSGLLAAQALWQAQDPVGARMHPIEPIAPKTYPQPLLLALKVLLAPTAAMARSVAFVEELAQDTRRPSGAMRSQPDVVSLFAQTATAGMQAYVDLWRAMGSVAGRMLR